MTVVLGAILTGVVVVMLQAAIPEDQLDGLEAALQGTIFSIRF